MSNIEIVQQVYGAFGRGDLDQVFALTAPDLVVEQDEALPWGGRHKGHDAFKAFITAIVGAIEHQIIPETMFAAGDQVIECGRARGTVRANGAPFDVAEAHVWTLRDGLIVRSQIYFDTPAMLNALGQPAVAT